MGSYLRKAIDLGLNLKIFFLCTEVVHVSSVANSINTVLFWLGEFDRKG